MKITKDKLPDGYIHPCSIREIKNYLGEIPKEDIKGIKCIRLTNKKSMSGGDGGYLHDGRIELVCVVDKNYRRLISGYGRPSENLYKEFTEFGGKVEYIDSQEFISWQPNGLKRYVKFVLFHEIGHHVYAKKYCGKLNNTSSSKEEKFADDYARRYL